ncbi:unnamed protein product, partial [Adineta steineri]
MVELAHAAGVDPNQARINVEALGTTVTASDDLLVRTDFSGGKISKFADEECANKSFFEFCRVCLVS